MEGFYLEIRAVHIASVLASGSLFLTRGLALNLFEARWAMAAPLRYLSWSVDLVLLTAALMLMSITDQSAFQDVWLAAKVLLLIPYIVLGYLGLRAPTRLTRLLCLAGAILVFGYIVSVARAHHPLGIFA